MYWSSLVVENKQKEPHSRLFVFVPRKHNMIKNWLCQLFYHEIKTPLKTEVESVRAFGICVTGYLPVNDSCCPIGVQLLTS